MSTDVEMNNWLVLPIKSLDDGKDHLLTFYVTDTYVSQSVDVYVHGNRCFDGLAPKSDLNGDKNPEYFSKVLTQNIDVTDNISGWVEVRVDLSDYAGQAVYVAIVQNGGKGDMRVDDIAWWTREPHTPVGDRKSVFYEGFEDNGTEFPAYWLAKDEDGDGNNWVVDNKELKRHHGNSCAKSMAGKGKSNNWLYMPSHTVSTTKKTTLTFEAAGSSAKYYDEYFGVYISVDDGAYKQIGNDYKTSFL